MSFGRFRDDATSNKTSPISESAPGFGASREAFISKGSKISGNMNFVGPAEIDGQIDGEINAQDRLAIGESAIVNAKITGSEITIRGVVTGDVYASKKLILKKPAKVTGNISAQVLSIEEGVVFEGKISMPQAEIKSIASEHKNTENRQIATTETAVDPKQTTKLSLTKGSGIF
jgi:cytoskeletal protein CcmA (bactofilin family)